MLHSLLCCNDDGFVLLARYFQPATPLETRAAYEAQLARACAQVPQLWDATTSGDQLVVCAEQLVVLRRTGELRWLLAGSGEYDELLLADVMSVWSAAVTLQLEKKLTETSLLTNYAKVVVALDEM
ncbi:hypothetical protein PybrP1_006615, partial [[Pythium] brassicae (nom. inval.)]